MLKEFCSRHNIHTRFRRNMRRLGSKDSEATEGETSGSSQQNPPSGSAQPNQPSGSSQQASGAQQDPRDPEDNPDDDDDDSNEPPPKKKKR